jgi:hypothetical protein
MTRTQSSMADSSHRHHNGSRINGRQYALPYLALTSSQAPWVCHLRWASILYPVAKLSDSATQGNCQAPFFVNWKHIHPAMRCSPKNLSCQCLYYLPHKVTAKSRPLPIHIHEMKRVLHALLIPSGQTLCIIRDFGAPL